MILSFIFEIYIFCFKVVLMFLVGISLCRYDREEGNTMFDADSSSFFLGDEASFQKKEAELAKRLVLLLCSFVT